MYLELKAAVGSDIADAIYWLAVEECNLSCYIGRPDYVPYVPTTVTFKFLNSNPVYGTSATGLDLGLFWIMF